MRAVREASPAHAYLFLGLEGTGKLTTALEFARALNCERDRDGHACGECALCKSVDHGNFPDLRVWAPAGQDTKIEQMREMRETASFAPLRGTWKVNIIEQGDTLNEESASCILKLLEEPPPYLVNILLYRNAANVLPTIRSRCQLVRFTQVDADTLASRLAEDFGAEPSEAEFLATYSQGRPGIAIRLVGNEEFRARRAAVLGAASATASGNPWLALKLAEAIRSSASFQEPAEEEETPAEEEVWSPKRRGSARNSTFEGLDILLTWYRDLLAVKLGGEQAPLVNLDRRDEVTRRAASYPSARRILDALDAILLARRGLLGNANAQIATEAMMMRLIGANSPN